MRKLAYILLFAIVLVGCKSAKHAVAVAEKPVVEAKPIVPSYLASKLELTIPAKSGGSMTIGGTMKMKGAERVQLSLLMPILRTEVARIEITPNEVVLVDRMNKRFVRATKEELKAILPKNAQFSHLEKLLAEASLPGGKTELTGKDLGLKSTMEKAKIQFYDFSTKEFTITPTELTSRYTQVSLEELIKMLVALL